MGFDHLLLDKASKISLNYLSGEFNYEPKNS